MEAIAQQAPTVAGASSCYDILVLDASYKQTLACARSLGRAGLRVALGESATESGPALPALAFHSRHSACNIALPYYAAGPSAVADAVIRFVRKHPTKVVLPTGDGTITALIPYRERLAELGSVLALAPDAALEVALDKDRTLEVARKLGIDKPKTMRIDNIDDLHAVIAEIGFPFVLKPTTSWSERLSDRLVPAEVINEREAIDVTQRFFDAGLGVLGQEWACGHREGVTLFIVNGDVLASCGHVAYRTSPPLGGASVMRESIPVPQDIYAASVSLAKAIGIQGVCEVEFRRDAENRALLMEINPRLAGTIYNAVHSGVDFPLMVWQWAAGLPVDRVPSYRTGVRTRWLHGDLRWLRDNQKRVGRPDSVSRARALWTFGTEFVRTHHYDCFDLRDLRPVMAELRTTTAAIRKSRNHQSSAENPHLKGRYVSTSEVLIIGAGPYGVSISAHLHGLNVDHQIVGRPMNSWRSCMPVGMLLKSEPYASEIASPKGGYDLAAYYKLHGSEYINRAVPVPLDRFLGYADWYVEQLVPGVRDVTAAEITAADGAFRVAFQDAEPVTARKVVVATGVLPFAHIPGELSGLPSDLVTHSSEHDRLDQFRGRRVAVVGAGQSSLETAALLHEAGADVTIIARIPKICFVDPNPAELSALGHIKRPVVKLCEGWHCAFWNSPMAFRRLPKDMRITKARTVLGPAGAAWLRDRVDGVIDTLTEHRVREAVPRGGGVRLLLDGPKQSAIEVDHVIAGTGFRVDLARLPFLPDRLRSRIATENGYPVLSRAGESTVPGLYFVGAPAAVSIGPSARFIAGTHNTAAKVARSLARRSNSGRANLAAAEADDVPQSSKNAAFQETA